MQSSLHQCVTKVSLPTTSNLCPPPHPYLPFPVHFGIILTLVLQAHNCGGVVEPLQIIIRQGLPGVSTFMRHSFTVRHQSLADRGFCSLFLSSKKALSSASRFPSPSLRLHVFQQLEPINSPTIQPRASWEIRGNLKRASEGVEGRFLPLLSSSVELSGTRWTSPC